MNYFEMEPMKYWSMSSSLDKFTRELFIEKMITSKEYIYSRKYDGNWSRAVITPEKKALQTRGLSKVTGQYGEIQDKVFFWETLSSIFSKDTVILGEIYLEKGIDKDVGSILRSLSQKAKSIQDEKYYNDISRIYKFSAKDKRDIEGNKFKNQKLAFKIFDVLVYEGENLMNSPITTRLQYIEKIVKKANHPLIGGVRYFEMDESFYDKLSSIFSEGGEGVVCYKKNSVYIPGKRGPHSWDTVKVKRELSAEIDCFITGIEPAVKNYTGTHLDTWMFWYNEKTGEKLYGDYYLSYVKGETCLIPISKGFYYGWPGAVHCGVYDENHNIYEICKVSGLEENFKEELKNNLNEWIMCPLTISGMMLSQNANDTGISVRHPIIKSIRKGDINPEDCTLEKIIS